MALDETVHASAARSAAQADPQLGQLFGCTRGYHLHVTILGVAYPAAQT